MEAQRIVGAGEQITGACIGFENQLVSLRLVPAEIEKAVPAVGTVVTSVPASRVKLRMPRLRDVTHDRIDVREGAPNDDDSQLIVGDSRTGRQGSSTRQFIL